MKALFASYRNELKLSLRDRNPQMIFIIFLALTSLSSLISWLTVRNVASIYEAIKRLGFTKAPSPFAGISSLYFVRNSVIYIILVGSLLAIILGTQASVRDRKSLTSPLIKSRNVSLTAKYSGQLFAIFSILFLALSIVTFAAYISIWLIQGNPISKSSTFHLLAYAAISWLLLIAIASFSFAYGFFTSAEENALLVPFIAWSAITFIAPLIATGARPVSLLNPTPSLLSGSGVPHALQEILSPLMVMENFKSIANSILGLDSTIKFSTTNTSYFIAFVLIGLMTPFLVPRSAFGRSINV